MSDRTPLLSAWASGFTASLAAWMVDVGHPALGAFVAVLAVLNGIFAWPPEGER